MQFRKADCRPPEYLAIDMYSIYYLPCHNYVGQTVQSISARLAQHTRAGKDVRGAIILESYLDRQFLDSVEAYWIGALSAFKPLVKFANHTRGNHLPSHEQGVSDRHCKL